MNKIALTFSLLAFLVPIGVVIALNMGESSSSQSAGQPHPNGKLVYYYAPS